jgi:hypothetical protein
MQIDIHYILIPTIKTVRITNYFNRLMQFRVVHKCISEKYFFLQKSLILSYQIGFPTCCYGCAAKFNTQ